MNDVCLLDDCNHESIVKGYCKIHYIRIKKYKNPNFTLKPRNRRCSVENCVGKHMARGFCNKHYQRFRLYGVTTYHILNTDHNNRCSVIGCCNKYLCRGYCVNHYFKYSNPKSNRICSIEEYISKLNVRKRDKNTCRWYGCGKTHLETSINVHHIFPRSEYPKLSSIEKYMICYCKEHHRKWHEARGDRYYSFI